MRSIPNKRFTVYALYKDNEWAVHTIEKGRTAADRFQDERCKLFTVHVAIEEHLFVVHYQLLDRIHLISAHVTPCGDTVLGNGSGCDASFSRTVIHKDGLWSCKEYQ